MFALLELQYEVDSMNQGSGERSRLTAKVGGNGSVTQAERTKTAAGDSSIFLTNAAGF